MTDSRAGEPRSDEAVQAHDDARPSTMDVPEWAYFSEALAWYDGAGLTGAQTFSVIQQVRQALRDGRITPADLGMIQASPFTKENHGSGCWYRSGGPCDCTARTRRYWRVSA